MARKLTWRDYIDMCWGFGSFFLFFINHFMYHHAAFSPWDLSFILAMSGVHTTSTYMAKKLAASQINHNISTEVTKEVENVTTNKSSNPS